MGRSTPQSGVRRRTTAGTDRREHPGAAADQRPGAPVTATEFQAEPTVTIPHLFGLADNPPYSVYINHVINEDRTYDVHRSRPRRPGTDLADLPRPPGAILRPSSSTYSDWRKGNSVPDTARFQSAVDQLISFLLKEASNRGHHDLPQRDAWINHLKANQPRQRTPPTLAGANTRALLADWCAGEARRHQAALARLPYLAGHPNPTTHHVTAHTRIGIRQQKSSEHSVADDPYRLAADQPDTRTVEMPYLDAVDQHRELIIIGDAGAGKTWLLHHHAITLAQQAYTALTTTATPHSQIALPILIRGDTLAGIHRPGQPLAETVIDALAASGSRIPRPIRAHILSHCRTGPAVYLLDALDETNPDHHATLAALLSPPDNTNSNTRYIATSRITGSIGVFDPRHRVEAELLPFTDPKPYIASWQLPPDRHRDLLDRITTHHAIAQMGRIPLLLAFLCHLANDPAEPLPDSRAELYERITRRFLSAEHRSHSPRQQRAQPHPLSTDPHTRADELLDVLRPLAYAIATHPDGWLDTIPHHQLLDHLRTIERPHNLTPAATLTLLTTHTGILTPTGSTTAGRTPPYRFIHRTLAEYLTAAHIAPNPNLIEYCSHHHLHLANDWHQTWLLTTQLNPAATLDILVTHPQDALHIALTTATSAVAELTSAQRQIADAEITALTTIASQIFEECPATSYSSWIAAHALSEIGGPDVAEVLMTHISDPDLDHTVISALGFSNDDHCSAATETIFFDPTIPIEIRDIAGRALTRSASAQPLQRMLVMPDAPDELRRRAAAGLCAAGDDTAIESLSLALNTIDSLHTSFTVMSALGKIGGPSAIATLSHAYENGPSYKYRIMAAQKLATLGRSDVVPMLSRALADPDLYAGDAAGIVSALLSAGEAGIDALCAHEHKARVGGPSWPLPSGASIAVTSGLDRIARRDRGGFSAQHLVRVLLSRMSDSALDVEARRSAMFLLSNTGGSQAITALLERLPASNQHSSLAEANRVALGRAIFHTMQCRQPTTQEVTLSEHGLTVLIAELENPAADSQLRLAAARALSQFDGGLLTRYLPNLLALLVDPRTDPASRDTLLITLCRNSKALSGLRDHPEEPGWIAWLIENLENHSGSTLCYVLEHIGSPRAVDALMSVASDRSADRIWRAHAIKSLGLLVEERNTSHILPLLTNLCRGGDADISGASTKALGRASESLTNATLRSWLSDSRMPQEVVTKACVTLGRRRDRATLALLEAGLHSFEDDELADAFTEGYFNGHYAAAAQGQIDDLLLFTLQAIQSTSDSLRRAAGNVAFRVRDATAIAAHRTSAVMQTLLEITQADRRGELEVAVRQLRNGRFDVEEY